MSKVTITEYTIRLKRSGTKEYQTLRQFDGNNDLRKALSDFINDRVGYSKIENLGDEKTIFYDEIKILATPDCINFTAKIGGYGISYPIFDHTTKELKYTRNTNDTDAFPLQFTIYIPGINDKSPDIGFLISEKYKNKAAKGLFETQFKKYLSEKFQDYTLEIEPIIPQEFFKFFDKGIISTTKIKSYSTPKNIEDSFTSGENTKSKSSVEVIINNMDLIQKKKKLISRIFKRKGHVDLHELFTGYIITPDEISFKGTLDGKERTVILKDDGESMVPGIDVTDQVKLSKIGFPEEELMRNVEVRYLNDLITNYK